MTLGRSRGKGSATPTRERWAAWPVVALTVLATLGLAAAVAAGSRPDQAASGPGPTTTAGGSTGSVAPSSIGAPSVTGAPTPAPSASGSDAAGDPAAYPSMSAPSGGATDVASVTTAQQIKYALDVLASEAKVMDVSEAKRIFASPLRAPITSPFGFRVHPILLDWRLHTGTDFGANCGVPVLAAREGVVDSVGEAGGYGLRVVIDHGSIRQGRLSTTYNHLSSISVRPGDRVDTGDQVGLVGTTGLSTGCHLHFEVHVGDAYTDPMPLISGHDSTAVLTPPPS